MKEAIALFSRRNNLTGVYVGTVEAYAARMNYDIQPGDEGGQFYRKGEKWPSEAVASYLKTFVHEEK